MSSNYRDRPEAIRALVQEDRVHRDLYLSDELFALEQERLFARTWLYAGHASQVPNTGDYWALELAGRPVMMVRQADGAVRVFYNRCAHKGSRLVTDESGNAGKFFRCPYHAWTYKLDGAPLAIPLKTGYEGTRLKECESGRGLVELKNTAVYRDFVFVRLSDRGPGFEDYFGEVLRAIDNMVERSPEGRLTVGGGVLRNIIHCNWKMYLENINDTVHPMSTHESATQAADALWQGRSPEEPTSGETEWQVCQSREGARDAVKCIENTAETRFLRETATRTRNPPTCPHLFPTKQLQPNATFGSWRSPPPSWV